MGELHVQIYSKGDQLPVITCRNFFHSEELFHICEQTPRMRPYMVAVLRDDNTVLCHMLGILRYRSSLFPPYLYTHCRIYGEGEYEADCDIPHDELFEMMLQSLTHKLQRWVLFIEVSHLSTKMFGYRRFRQCSYFPVHWMSIHIQLFR